MEHPAQDPERTTEQPPTPESDLTNTRLALAILFANQETALSTLEKLVGDPSGSGPQMSAVDRAALQKLSEEARRMQASKPTISAVTIQQVSDDVWALSSPQWPGGQLTWMSRNRFDLERKRNKFLFPEAAVYFLWSEHLDSNGRGQMYIGETKSSIERLDQQSAKPTWTRVAFASSNELIKSYATHVEAVLIAKAKLANRYQVENANNGQSEALPASHMQTADAFVSSLLQLLAIGNFDFFIPQHTGVFEHISSGAGKSLTMRVKLIDAAARELVILPGSRLWTVGKRVPSEVTENGLEAYGALDGNSWLFHKEVKVTLERNMARILGHIGTSSLRSQNGISLYATLEFASASTGAS